MIVASIYYAHGSMKNSVLIFILLFFSYQTSLLAAQLSQITKPFAAFVKQELKQHSIPGAAYTIVQGNKAIATETFGYTDLKKKKPINNQTIFRLASVSKPFAATIAAMLVEDNKLDWQDKVTEYVPEFKLAKAGAADKINLSHILSHSSGLTPNAYDNLLNANVPMPKIIKKFDRVSPICEPARCYGYQNVAFSFIQPAIEASQPKSYAQLLQDEIFTPLYMANASVGWQDYLNNPNSAKPHVLIKKRNTNRFNSKGKRIKQYVWRTVKVTPNYYHVEPAAGINASINDMSQWLIANLGYRPDILSKALLNELTTPKIKTKKDLRRLYWREHLTDAHYGYGWRIYQFAGHKLIYHSGWVSGFRADIAYAPDLKIGFAILLNAESNNINKITTHFWQKVFETLKDG